MTQIITLGEVLIDLTQTGVDEKGVSEYAAFPGGAPANVAVAASRLGAKTGFVGKVGSDSFGQKLKKTLSDDDVDVTYLFETANVPTTLAIVSVDEKGERSFSFYRDPGADTQLTADEATWFLSSAELPAILHFGSLSLTTEPSRSASLAAVKGAREKGILISYDPNYREALWESLEEAVFWMKKPLEMADILKISDEELVLLTGTDNLDEGSKRLCEYGINLVLITLGSEGVYYRVNASGNDACGQIPATHVQVCDTNGAGDTFLGAVLAQIANGERDQDGSLCLPSEEKLKKYLAFANRAAALTCSRAGAIPAMPRLEEMDLAK